MLICVVFWLAPFAEAPAQERPDYSHLLDAPHGKLLSGAAEVFIRTQSGLDTGVLLKLAGQSAPDILLAPPNVLVNDPTLDGTVNTTQSETSHAISDATGTIVGGWNDSGEFPVSGNFTGYGRSTDSGASFTDLGPPTPIAGGGHFGDPSLAYRAADASFLFATLGAEAGWPLLHWRRKIGR